MSDRKYSVFVSSSYRDLKEHRAKVIEALNNEGHFPVAMEFFKPDYRRNEDFIRDEISKCDIFAIFVGVISGSEVEPDVRFTEFEYEVALQLNKKIIRFVCENSDLSSVDTHESLLKFRERILGDGTISGYFSMSSPDGLAATFASSLRSAVDQIEKEEPSGWIRSEEYDRLKRLRHLSPKVSGSILASNIIDTIEECDIFLSRSNDDADEKVDMARFFWRMAFAGVFEDSSIRNFFFDASSSSSFFSKRLSDLINSNPHYLTAIPNDSAFMTNCLLTYMDWKCQPLDKVFPTGSTMMIPNLAVSRDYAAAYGPVQNTISISATSFTRGEHRLRTDANQAIDETTDLLNSALKSEHGLVFTSFPGVNFTNEGYTGGYASSYKYCLFKRALMHTKSPKVIILDGRKWNIPMDEETQFPIFTDGIEWDKFMDLEPVCFVLSTKLAEKRRDMLEFFRGIGFHKPLTTKIDDNNLIIVFNENFKEASKII
ncbi:MAG: DUF4062 domain-containing protein [Paracoccaceae bacterium]